MIDYNCESENFLSVEFLQNQELDEISGQIQTSEILDYCEESKTIKQVEYEIVEINLTEWKVSCELQMNSHFSLSAQLISSGGSPFQIEKDSQILLYRTLANYNFHLAPGVFYLDTLSEGFFFKLTYSIYQEIEINLQYLKEKSYEIMRNSIQENIRWLLFLSNQLLVTPRDAQQICESLSKLIENEYELRNKYSNLLPTQKETNSRGPRQLNEIFIREFCEDKINVAIYAIKRMNCNVIREELVYQQFTPEETANLLQIGDLLSTKVNESESGYTPFLLVYYYSDIQTVYTNTQNVSTRFLIQDVIHYKTKTSNKFVLRCLFSAQEANYSIFIGPNGQATLGFLQYSYCESRQSQHNHMSKQQYLPPEFITSKITDKFDIFQIGILMLQFLYDITDEELDGITLLEFESRILNSGLKVLSVCIAQILFKCLDQDPIRRPSIGDLIIILKQVEEHLQTFYST